MPQWRFQSSPEAATINGGDVFCPVFGRSNSTTEADVELRIYTAYTLTDLRVEMVGVTPAVNFTVSVRDDGVTSTNLTITSSGAGWFEDLTGSDTPAANSDIAIECLNTGMHGDSMTFETLMLTYEHASINQHVVAGGENTSFSATQFMGFPNHDFRVNETDQEVRFQRAQTASNFRITATGVSGTWTLDVRQNGASSGNLSITITGNGTVEDLVGTEVFAAGDDGNFRLNEDVAGAIDPRMLQVDFDTAENFWGTSSTFFSTIREYISWSGPSQDFGGTPNDNYLARIGPQIAQHIQTIITFSSGTSTLSLRVNTTNSTNVAVTITSFGFFEDNTGFEAIADGDSVTLTVLGDDITTAHKTNVEFFPESVLHTPFEHQPEGIDRRLEVLAF